MTDTISDQPLVAIDPAWPRVSLADATAALTAPGSKFEMDMATIRGIPTRVWTHAPADLGVLLDLSRRKDAWSSGAHIVGDHPGERRIASFGH